MATSAVVVVLTVLATMVMAVLATMVMAVLTVLATVAWQVEMLAWRI
jgi:hypothetical protein